jgi:hypothetical protein
MERFLYLGGLLSYITEGMKGGAGVRNGSFEQAVPPSQRHRGRTSVGKPSLPRISRPLTVGNDRF